MTKPEIGLILLRAEWFDAVVQLPELTEAVQEDARQIHLALENDLCIRHVWVINSAAALAACVEALKTADCDLFVLCFQVWAEDYYLNPLLDALNRRPLMVWCYQPQTHPPLPAQFLDVLRFSGAVGVFEGMGTLRNLGVDYTFTFGSPQDGRPAREILAVASAARVLRLLRSARFGLLPARNEQMQSTFVDEFRLRRDLGPQVEYLSVGELARAAANIDPQAAARFADDLRGQCVIEDVEDAALLLAAKTALGMAALTEERRLDVLSLNDISPELHEVLGLRPCLYPPVLAKQGRLWGLEGDLGAAAALFVLHQLTLAPCMFVEFWFWDETENWLVGGHAGVQNPAAAGDGRVSITRDYEFAQADASPGAHYQFVAAPGPVTLLQLRCTPDGWQAIAAAGESLAGGPWLEGYPHAAVRLEAGVESFLRQCATVGTTQHWILARGIVLAKLEILFRMLQIPCQTIYRSV